MNERRWISAGLVGLAAALFAWWLLKSDVPRLSVPEPAATPAPAAPAPPPQQAAQAEAPSPPPDVQTGMRSAANCREQSLQLALDGRGGTRICFGGTQTLQTGNVRRYAIAAQDDSGWSIDIDARGEQVLGAQADNGKGLRFECAEGKCGALRIGKHDAQGARTIRLEGLALRQTGGKGSAEETTRQLVISGELRTLPDAQVSGLACPEQGVNIVSSDGSAIGFCPLGGAGMEFLDNGRRRFEFSSLDAGTIFVYLDAQSRPSKVEFEGGRLSCVDAECGGVRIGEPDAQGARQFAFAGTTLREAASSASGGGVRFVQLTGTLQLPGGLY